MARAYPPEVKAAVIAELAAGDALTYVAKKHGISRPAIQKWRDQAGLNPAFAGDVITEKREQIGRQLLDLTSRSIDTLGFLLDQVRDPTWFRGQPAGEIATLFGVISDKTVRLLAALHPDGESGGVDPRSADDLLPSHANGAPADVSGSARP